MKTRKQKTSTSAERVALYVVTLAFIYTAGLYKFFTKTCEKIARVIIPVLEKLSKKGGELKTATGKDAAALVSGLWIVNHFARKLEGISSISSSVHDNCKCSLWRTIKGCICELCYAFNQQAFQTGLREHNILNGIILRNVLLPVCALKKLSILFDILRIESFGDVANVIQARNYIRIIKAFPGKRCAIWTKNIEIWHAAFEIEGKPENCTFVVSSPFVNKPIEKTILKNYPEIDHIFTVFTKTFAKANNIVINCGGRKCLECIKAKINCYFRGGELYINELVK